MAAALYPHDLVSNIRWFIRERIRTSLEEKVKSYAVEFIESLPSKLYSSLAPTSIGQLFIDSRKEELDKEMVELLKNDSFLIYFFRGLDNLVKALNPNNDDCRFVGQLIVEYPEWKIREKEFKKLIRDNAKVREVMGS